MSKDKKHKPQLGHLEEKYQRFGGLEESWVERIRRDMAGLGPITRARAICEAVDSFDRLVDEGDKDAHRNPTALLLSKFDASITAAKKSMNWRD